MKNSRNSGVSLIVATIFTAVMMLMIAGLAEVIIKSTQIFGDSNTSGKINYLAQSAEELTNLYASKKPVGYNGAIDGTEPSGDADVELKEFIEFLENEGIDCADIDPDPTVTKPCMGFRIIGSSEEKIKADGLNTLYYSVPAAYMDGDELKGTGSAAEECKDAGNADDPCYWNKLYLNDATEIPLYVENTAISPFSQIKIRVRSPCGEFKFSNSAAKYECGENVELYPKVSTGSPGDPSPFRKIDKDKVLIQWLILGGDGMVVAKDHDQQAKLRPTPKQSGGTITDENTEISAGRIDDAKGLAGSGPKLGDFLGNYVVLDENYSGMYLNKEPIKFKKLIESKSKLKLYLNLVGTPRREDDNENSALEFTPDQLNDSKYFLPYLEYQILTDEPIADSRTSLFSWAEIADFYKESNGKRTFPVTTEPFVLGGL